MKKNNILILVALAVLFVGCKKEFLDTRPFASIDEAGAFSSAERVQAAMTGLYDLVTTNSFNTHIALATDIKGGDMVLVSAGNYSRFVTEYRFLQTPTAGYGVNFWSGAYKLITNCNVAIARLPDAPIEEAAKKDYLAEARALRAWAHLHLVRLFAQPFAFDPNAPGIPIVDKVLVPNATIPGRGTVRDVYNFITDDLLFAKQNMLATRTNNSGRLILNSVNGLLARVYLDQEVWDKAAEHARLARTGYPLAAAATLLNGFVDRTSEWIWTLIYRSDDNTGFLQIASFQEPYDIGYSTFRATTSFLNLFADSDIRRRQFFVNTQKVANPAVGEALQRDAIVYSRDGYLMNKFYFRSSWDLNVPMMRSAEMFLIEAEAEAEQDHDALAQDALFEVQRRAISDAVKSTSTGAALKTEIRDERRKELYGEGFRFYDVMRKKETLVRTAPDHWSPVNLAPGNYLNILPIPQAEREVSGILQNTGYPD